MLLADMKHSQLHMILYQEVVFLSGGGKIWCSVKSLMIVLFS